MNWVVTRENFIFLGGAGGKGTWGKLGDELGVESMTTDVKDPNYDSDGQASQQFVIAVDELYWTVEICI